MANPQKERGFTAIANEIVDKFCRYRLSGEEWLVLWVILRKTYGWNKKEDKISLSQFSVMTDMKRPSVVRAIKKLVAKELLTVNKEATSFGNMYRFNKDFDKWSAVTKKLPVVAKLLTGSSNIVNKVVTKKLHTKDNTKDIIQKKEILLFWEYFLLKTKKKFTLTKDKKDLIKKCLSEHSLDDLKRAVDNFVADDWAGRSDNLDLIYCIGKQKGKPDNLEKWLNIEGKNEKGEKLRPGTNIPEKYFNKKE